MKSKVILVVGWKMLVKGFELIDPSFNFVKLSQELPALLLVEDDNTRRAKIIELVDACLTFDGTWHGGCEWLESKDRKAVRAVVNAFSSFIEDISDRLRLLYQN